MNLGRLALRNIAGSAFRSWVIALCALVVAGLALSTTLLVGGAQSSLRLALERLGADILVVPKGAQGRVETALLMGKPVSVWMPEENLAKIASVPGVAVASPQVYLASLANAACCSASEMFVVVYDPHTDFTLTPWLKGKLGHGLRLGEVIGGSLVFTPEGEQNIKLYGYFLTLVGNLEATGTGLDQTMFLTSETAHDVARISVSRAEKPLVIPAQSISAVLIQVAPGANPGEVAQRIAREVPGVSAMEGAGLFRDYREQISALSALMAPVLATTLALAMVAIVLVFSLAANERRREVGVLRALGASRGFVLQSLLAEAGILALAGGVAGIALAGPGTMLFRHFIIMSLGMPFALPSAGSLLARIGEGLLLALASVTLAALYPALKSSRQDPAVAMRE